LGLLLGVSLFGTVGALQRQDWKIAAKLFTRWFGDRFRLAYPALREGMPFSCSEIGRSKHVTKRSIHLITIRFGVEECPQAYFMNIQPWSFRGSNGFNIATGIASFMYQVVG